MSDTLIDEAQKKELMHTIVTMGTEGGGGVSRGKKLNFRGCRGRRDIGGKKGGE